MPYMLCYKLIQAFRYVVRDRLQEATHRFLVVWRNTAIALNHHLFVLTQPSNRSRSSDARDDVQNIETYGIQCFQIASIRAALVSFVASLSVSGYAPDLSHFLLFKTQSNPFFTQAFARTQLRDLTI
jgi:hypothetical protein